MDMEDTVTIMAIIITEVFLFLIEVSDSIDGVLPVELTKILEDITIWTTIMDGILIATTNF